MKSTEADGSISIKIDDLDMLKHRLDSEFQRTIFRIISLILTWLIGIFSIYILIDVGPLLNQIGIAGSILFTLLFPILLIIAWGAADHQRRVDLTEDIAEKHDVEHMESDVDQIIDNADKIKGKVGENLREFLPKISLTKMINFNRNRKKTNETKAIFS